MDPYKVLGIVPHSSEADLKEAYDKVLNTYNLNDLEDESIKPFYEEKISEANEAFRIITHNMACEEVRDLIDRDEFIAAEAKLNLVSDISSAEWNYLKGVLLIKKGWVDSGISHIKKAVNLNPYNNEYISTMKKLNQKVGEYKTNYQASQRQGGNNLCGGNNGTSNNKNGLC